VLAIWECALKGRSRLGIDRVATETERFLDDPGLPIAGIAGDTNILSALIRQPRRRSLLD
jgi:hypothetical protein